MVLNPDATEEGVVGPLDGESVYAANQLAGVAVDCSLMETTYAPPFFSIRIRPSCIAYVWPGHTDVNSECAFPNLKRSQCFHLLQVVVNRVSTYANVNHRCRSFHEFADSVYSQLRCSDRVQRRLYSKD